MTRQVRLDEDVADWIDGQADGLSLSGATNRLLRQIAAERAQIDQDASGAPDASIDEPKAGRSPQATTERLARPRRRRQIAPSATPVAPDRPGSTARPIDATSLPLVLGEDEERAQRQITTARRARRSRSRCPHPASRRVGERCGQCGQVVR